MSLTLICCARPLTPAELAAKAQRIQRGVPEVARKAIAKVLAKDRFSVYCKTAVWTGRTVLLSILFFWSSLSSPLPLIRFDWSSKDFGNFGDDVDGDADLADAAADSKNMKKAAKELKHLLA